MTVEGIVGPMVEIDTGRHVRGDRASGEPEPTHGGQIGKRGPQEEPW